MRDGFYSSNPFNLNDMLTNNKNLNSYYESLPDYVKESINLHADNIKSEEELRDYADKLLEND